MNRLLQLGVNEKGRDFVIGDIHGKHTQLMEGLERVDFDGNKDRLIAVGDLVDRGKENMKVLKLLFENWFYTVVGNHEHIMADGITASQTPYTGRNKRNFWVYDCGGTWFHTLWDFEIDELQNIYAPMIYDELPVGIEFIAENGKKVGVTHAGLPRAWTWSQFKKHLECVEDINDVAIQNALWTRSRFEKEGDSPDILGVDLLINGHTPSKEIKWVGNNVFIDLGAYNPDQLNPINVMDLLEEMDKT